MSGIMRLEYDGFQWDEGNKNKIPQHGLTVEDVESAFYHIVSFSLDDRYDYGEDRFIAVCRLSTLRYVFISFTFRYVLQKKLVRPISARYMHMEEIKKYEKT
jgi:uncharacterized DUF497 family protein